MPKRPAKKPVPAPPATTRVLPKDLKPGDRLIDKRREWEIIWRPHTSAAGKTVSVYVQLVGQPTVAEIRSWAAHERVSVKREEGKR